MENQIVGYNIVDFKPPNIDELEEIITHAEFHPHRSDQFLFAKSKGSIFLCDLRANSKYESCSTVFQFNEDPSKKHFFTDIINSISSAIFSKKDDNYIFSRDYVSVKIWDVRKPSEHVRSLQVCDYIDKKLCDLYEAESVFDKFTLANSPDGRFLMTGAYNNNAHIIDKECYANTTLFAGFE